MTIFQVSRFDTYVLRDNQLSKNTQVTVFLSHIEQICSRQLRKHLRSGKSVEGILTNKKLKTLWQKEKLLVLSNSSFCHDVFKSSLLKMRQNASIGVWQIDRQGRDPHVSQYNIYWSLFFTIKMFMVDDHFSLKLLFICVSKFVVMVTCSNSNLISVSVSVKRKVKQLLIWYFRFS